MLALALNEKGDLDVNSRENQVQIAVIEGFPLRDAVAEIGSDDLFMIVENPAGDLSVRRRERMVAAENAYKMKIEAGAAIEDTQLLSVIKTETE